MNKTTVVNVKTDQYDVYIGQDARYGPATWGNPFVTGDDGDSDEVIKKYNNYIRRRVSLDNSLYTQLLDLGGKRLGCHCKPRACHGEMLVKLLEDVK